MINNNYKKGFIHATELRNSVRGFTLLEALVAISILMVAVAAPITISQKGLSSAVYTKSQMVASYLAQDVFEYIKNKKDEHSINYGFDWNNLDSYGLPLLASTTPSIFSKCIGSNHCQIDTIKNSGDTREDIFDGTNPVDLKVLKKNSNGFYQYVDGDDTAFTRKINITMNPYGNNSDEALVDVIVTWGSDSDNKVDVKGLIYNY